jgi:NADPH:quinone reductase
MDHEIRIAATGGTEMLALCDHAPKQPGPGEIRIRQHAIGVNFVDIYHRSGIYPLPALPVIPGVEGAGVVEATGDGVEDFKPGDRVAYAGMPLGAYASTRLLPAKRAIHLPGDIPFELAAGSMLRGLTAYMLFNRVFPLKAGSTILVHAAAGGLGQYLCRWATHTGATVIGTTSNEAKSDIARAAGAHHVITGRDTDFVEAINGLTNGRGVDAIFDGVGGPNFARNFQAVAPFGVVASVGQAAGPIAPVPVSALSPRAASLSRPSVIAYISNDEAYHTAARSVFAMIGQGVTASIGKSYPLTEARQAHADMEAGLSTGSLLLIP